MREACLPGSTGLVTAQGDRLAFGRALASFLANPQRREAMGKRAKAFALDRFSPERQADEVLEFLESVR